jgi:CHAT domain-containing protein
MILGALAMRLNPMVCATNLKICCAACLALMVAGTAVAQPQPADSAKKAPSWKVLTGDDAKQVAELEKQANELEAADKHVEAEPLYRKVLAIRRKVLGEDHPDTGTSYHNLAANLHDQGKLAEAVPLYRTALAIRRKTIGEEHADTALTCNHLALALDEQGKSVQAEPLYRQALAIRRKVLGEDHAATAFSYHNLAVNLDDQRKYAEAEPLYRKALAIRRKVLGEEHLDTAHTANHLALNLDEQGKFAEAEPLYRSALAIRRKLVGEEDPATAVSYNNLASNLGEQSKYAEAEPLFRKALVIRRKLLGEEDEDTAISYNNLAANLNDQGRYAEAEPLYRQALAIRRKLLGEDHVDTAQGFNNVAHNLRFQGRYAEAEPLYRKALAIRRKALGDDDPETANSFNSLALNLDAQGQHAQAEVLYRKVLAIRRKQLGAEHPRTADSYNNVAFCLDSQEQYARAEPLYRQALAIYRKALGEDHADTALGYNNLAANLDHQGKYAEALPFYRRALAIRRKTLGEYHPDTAQSYADLASCLNAQGQYAEAEKLWRAAAKSFEVARLGVSFAGLERASFAAEQSPLPQLAACLARAGKASDGWSFWEANLARGLLDDLSAGVARSRSETERSRHQELVGQLQRIDKQIAALVRPKEQTDAHRQQVEKLQQQRDAAVIALTQFEAALAQRHGPAAGQVYNLARIQAQLPADAALLSWIDFQGRPKAVDPHGEHWACVVRQRGEPVWVKLPGSGLQGAWTADDNQLSDKVRELLARPPADVTVTWQDQTSRLYRQRLAPLAKSLGATTDLPSVRHLIILPSEWMAGVPVEAVVAARTDQQPAYTISYAPSGTMFAWLQEQHKEAQGRERKSDRPRLLALGDPAFGPSFPRLAGSRREVEAIARLFEDPKQLLGKRASEQQLEQLAASGRLQDYRYLHLATHGVLDPKNAMHSALILSLEALPDPLAQVLAGERAYDGRLTAAQILRTWKLDADLVTLSACQSGLGKHEGGEGYLGFAQALFVAGSRSLVLSQWSVDDNATALLMSRFYQNLLGKRKGLAKPMPKAEALQEAKVWLRGLTEDEVDQHLTELPRGREVKRPRTVPARVHPYAHPYYWAAFILIGDPR